MHIQMKYEYLHFFCYINTNYFFVILLHYNLYSDAAVFKNTADCTLHFTLYELFSVLINKNPICIFLKGLMMILRRVMNLLAETSIIFTFIIYSKQTLSLDEIIKNNE